MQELVLLYPSISLVIFAVLEQIADVRTLDQAASNQHTHGEWIKFMPIEDTNQKNEESEHRAGSAPVLPAAESVLEHHQGPARKGGD